MTGDQLREESGDRRDQFVEQVRYCRDVLHISDEQKKENKR